jgi:hypothetical protein
MVINWQNMKMKDLDMLQPIPLNTQDAAAEIHQYYYHEAMATGNFHKGTSLLEAALIIQ